MKISLCLCNFTIVFCNFTIVVKMIEAHETQMAAFLQNA